MANGLAAVARAISMHGTGACFHFGEFELFGLESDARYFDDFPMLVQVAAQFPTTAVIASMAWLICSSVEKIDSGLIGRDFFSLIKTPPSATVRPA